MTGDVQVTQQVEGRGEVCAICDLRTELARHDTRCATAVVLVVGQRNYYY